MLDFFVVHFCEKVRGVTGSRPGGIVVCNKCRAKLECTMPPGEWLTCGHCAVQNESTQFLDMMSLRKGTPVYVLVGCIGRVPFWYPVDEEGQATKY